MLWNLDINNTRFFNVSNCGVIYSIFFTSHLRPSGVARHASHLFFTCVKKSNQKKAHNLTKIDPDITYSLWDSFIQYILAAPTKTFFTRLSCSSESKLSSSQYHYDSSDFFKTQCGCNEQVQQASFYFKTSKNRA